MKLNLLFQTTYQSFTKKSKSTRWFKQHISDLYVKKAQQENYRSRAAFKLLEVNEKYKIIKPNDKILDLGSAPGGWTQVAVELTKSESNQSKIVSVDILEMKKVIGSQFIQKNILEKQTTEQIKQLFNNNLIDCIISDMAPNFVNDLQINHYEIAKLNLMTIQSSFQMLKKGGNMVMKTLQGENEKLFYDFYKVNFKQFIRFKPQSSRSHSQEMFYVGKGFLQDFQEYSEIKDKRSSIQFYDQISIDDIERMNMKGREKIEQFWKRLIKIDQK